MQKLQSATLFPDSLPTIPVEVVVMVGIAGSGKTTYSRRRFSRYVHISMDTYHKDKSWPTKRARLIRRCDRERPAGMVRITSGNKKAECILADDALGRGKSVVVDDTNLTRAIRRPYLMLARKHGAIIRAVFFGDFERARVQNAGRAEDEDRVDEGILDRQLGELERPSRTEGFDDVLVAS